MIRKIVTSKEVFIITFLSFIFVSATLACTLTYILIYFELIHKANDLDILDNYIRLSFLLIGSAFSGFTAFFIFILSKYEENKENKRKESNFEDLLNKQYCNNLKVLQDLNKKLKKFSTNDLLDGLEKDSSLKENFFIQHSKLNINIYELYLKDFANHQIKIIEEWEKLIQIKNYLNFIISEVKDRENLESLINGIKEKIDSLEN